MEDPMNQIDDWIHRIDEGKIDGELQNKIADKILELLEQKKDSLGSRDKLLFADAITALSININSIYQPSEVGLRRCLKTLRKIMVPEEVLDESYAARHEEANNISFAMLVTTVQLIKDQIF